MNPLGVHALVWTGSTDPGALAGAVESTRAAGYDLLELSLHDTDGLDVDATRRASEAAGLELVVLRGLGFEAGPSAPGAEKYARGKRGGTGEDTTENQAPCKLRSRLLREKKKKNKTIVN